MKLAQILPSYQFRLLYAGYIFSCIGDRLWTFAIILLLERLGGMRLVSANQLIEGVSAMIIATHVGNWLDRKNRRVGALTILAVNNLCVALSATFLAVCLSLLQSADGRKSAVALLTDDADGSDWTLPLYTGSLIASIVFCAVSKCASDGQKMALTKDWIVVMAANDASDTLSGRNAIMTTIDQTSSVIAPLIAGYVFSLGGYRSACALFVVWNLVSWFAERQLLSAVYAQVPDLATRHETIQYCAEEDEEQSEKEIGSFVVSRHNAKKSDSSSSNYVNQVDKISLKPEFDALLDQSVDPKVSKQTMAAKDVGSATSAGTCWHHRMASALRAYRRQSVFAAAFALSLLYMTVLGFDGLAISHGKAQHLPDAVLGWFRSAGSILGILGAFAYTVVERRAGVRRTGLVGLLLQQSFLWMCIASIWLPGSPFAPRQYAREWTLDGWTSSAAGAFSGTVDNYHRPPLLLNHTASDVPSGAAMTLRKRDVSMKVLPATADPSHLHYVDWSTWTVRNDANDDQNSVISIVIFFCGITFARLGLWMADLSITQIMQESIAEEERNTVFGTQNALSQLFSVLKDVVVVAFPDHRTFGLLIMMSMCFVSAGLFFYVYYLAKTAHRKRGKQTQQSVSASCSVEANYKRAPIITVVSAADNEKSASQKNVNTVVVVPVTREGANN